MRATLARWLLVAGSLLFCIWVALSPTRTSISSPRTELYGLPVGFDEISGTRLQKQSLTSKQHIGRPANSRHNVKGRGLFDSADFKRARDKGRQILCAFDKGEVQTGTGFDKTSDLKDWGWTSVSLDGETVDATLKNYVKELSAKGLSAVSKDVEGVQWTHNVDTEHSGIKYPATGGIYTVLFDPDRGMIIPARSYGPAYKVQQESNGANGEQKTKSLPKLRVWSDVAFLTWLEHTTPEQRQKLHYVVNINCNNQTTVDVVSEALKKDGVKSGVPPKWPGHSFALVNPGPFSANDAYEAVLGTPNVLGTG